jgi:hypothetical protein
MRTLLIYPQYPDTFWSFKHALKFIHKKAAFPALGLLTIASMLPKEWPKKLVDLNVTKLTEKDLAWADCAISGMVSKENRPVKPFPGASVRASKSSQEGLSSQANTISSRRWITSCSMRPN